MILHTAELLFPISAEPRRDAAVLLDEQGVVVAVGSVSELQPRADRRVDHQILMPGVVNAHTHLVDAEIAEPIPGGEGLPAWVRRLMDRRLELKEGGGDDSDRIDLGPKQSVSPRAVADVLASMAQAGTVAVGEVCNGMATAPIIRDVGMRCRFIQEVLAFPAQRAEEALATAIRLEASEEWSQAVRPTIGAHAPYSVSPELMAAICAHNRDRGRMTFQHLAEDPAERELYQLGTGPWREYLERVGAWDSTWTAPGVAPIELYDRTRVLGPWLVAVHLADARPEEIALLSERGVSAVLSPRSNQQIGRRLPPLPAIARSGMRFALGTDGRGSSPTVDVFDEATVLAIEFPEVDPLLLFRALTAGGAHVLGFDELGTIEPGRRPGFVSAEVARVGAAAADVARAVLLEPVRRVGVVGS